MSIFSNISRFFICPEYYIYANKTRGWFTCIISIFKIFRRNRELRLELKRGIESEIKNNNDNDKLIVRKVEGIELNNCPEDEFKSQLDTIEIAPKSLNGEKNPIYVLNFGGSGGCYELNFESAKVDSIKNNCINILFNYPGVGDSTGTISSKDDIVEAGIAQIQRLINNGVRPSQIILKGYCGGALYATLIAERMHSQGKKVFLFSDRSLASTVDFSVNRFFKFLTNFISKDWIINAGEKFLEIPEEFREYTTIQTRGNSKENKILLAQKYCVELEKLSKDSNDFKEKYLRVGNLLKSFSIWFLEQKKYEELVEQANKNYKKCNFSELNKILIKLNTFLKEDKLKEEKSKDVSIDVRAIAEHRKENQLKYIDKMIQKLNNSDIKSLDKYIDWLKKEFGCSSLNSSIYFENGRFIGKKISAQELKSFMEWLERLKSKIKDNFRFNDEKTKDNIIETADSLHTYLSRKRKKQIKVIDDAIIDIKQMNDIKEVEKYISELLKKMEQSFAKHELIEIKEIKDIKEQKDINNDDKLKILKKLKSFRERFKNKHKFMINTKLTTDEIKGIIDENIDNEFFRDIFREEILNKIMNKDYIFNYKSIIKNALNKNFKFLPEKIFNNMISIIENNKDLNLLDLEKLIDETFYNNKLNYDEIRSDFISELKKFENQDDPQITEFLNTLRCRYEVIFEKEDCNIEGLFEELNKLTIKYSNNKEIENIKNSICKGYEEFKNENKIIGDGIKKLLEDILSLNDHVIHIQDIIASEYRFNPHIQYPRNLKSRAGGCLMSSYYSDFIFRVRENQRLEMISLER